MDASYDTTLARKPGKIVLKGSETGIPIKTSSSGNRPASFKAEAVNELELDVYVEDRPGVREHLREHCPDCIVLSPGEARRIWRFET